MFPSNARPTATGLLAVAVLLVAGCTSTTPSTTPSAAAASEAPTAEAAPAFVELTDEQASERYLDLVCPNNAAIRDLRAAFAAGEDEFLAGGEPDPAAARAAAADRIELNRQTLTLLDDDYFRWPTSIAGPLEQVRSSYLAELATLDSMANAASFSDAYYATFPPATPEQESAGQEIRYALGIEPDTVTSCVGHEAGMDQLTAEYEARQAAQR